MFAYENIHLLNCSNDVLCSFSPIYQYLCCIFLFLYVFLLFFLSKKFVVLSSLQIFIIIVVVFIIFLIFIMV